MELAMTYMYYSKERKLCEVEFQKSCSSHFQWWVTLLNVITVDYDYSNPIESDCDSSGSFWSYIYSAKLRQDFVKVMHIFCYNYKILQI